MSNVPIKDANEATRKVDVFTRTEGADTVEVQAVALVDPDTGTPLNLATQATVAALLTAAQAIQAAADALNAKTTAVNTGAIAGTVALDGPSLAALESVTVSNMVAQGLTDQQLRADPVPVTAASLGEPSNAPATDDTGTFSLIALVKRALSFWSSLASAVRASNSPFTDGDKGIFVLGKRRDSDTTIVADGDYEGFSMDEAGRLKVATQPGSVPAVSGSITAAGQTVAIATGRIGTLSIAMVGAGLAGHNSIFEFSNDSTDGESGNWKTVQAVRTDSNIVEPTTGVLAATPAYGWELNVSAYAWFRVRATGHTGGTAAYTLKPGVYASEPVPSSQNPPLQEFTFTQAGAVAINTVVVVIDCQNFRSLAIQCLSMGTSGKVTLEWSNNPAGPWISSYNGVNGGSVTNSLNSAASLNTAVYGRYFRLRMSAGATAGTTTFSVMASQSPQPSITQIIGSAGLNAGTARVGFTAAPGVWYDDSSTVLAAAATFTSASRDLTLTATATQFANASTFAKEVRVSAESDQSGTLWMEVSRDNVNWRRVKSVPTAAVTGGGQYAEIVHRPSWRYARFGFTNGATLQTRFSIGSILMAN
ncbi:hypothetical protein [Rhodoferax sp.]|uniref:hypothetical protein n=1 Tax=Rhodoferax sp. TaxID=50421 RepID=UPI002ACD7CCB|nr:hypothetical protein [Rhodoferax sp.]MDZ7920740.1 hypothetical protein [Rhodoferax sp.]